ncbi:MAG: MBOAT family O-acyltransferase [Bryobacteraceae bacterium]
MLFNSLEFVLFLPIVLIVYYRLSHEAQNKFLLVASCIFYASWDWRFLLPLLVSTTIDYWAAERIQQLNELEAPIARRRKYLALSVGANLSLLGFFKYFNFFSESLQDLLALLGFQTSLWTLQVILPVGISFYTFQAMSYTFDVYRGQMHPTRRFRDFLLAVLYFPHLVAGPIQRANNLLQQVMTPRVVTKQKIIEGVHLIMWGFFKKVFVADNVAPIVDRIFALPSPTGFETLIGVYAFAVQIFCDFSGYTDIARGVAKLMGFEFVLNFNQPYVSTNPQEFWTRWHISLSTWLRDYLYISLGGNRKGERRTYLNLMLTMLIGGFWHGAAWNFILWGFYHGALLVTHRASKSFLDRIFDAVSLPGRAASFTIRWFVMLQLTCYGWLLFRAASFEQIRTMSFALLQPFEGFDGALAMDLFLFSLPLLLVELVQFFTKQLDFLSFRWIPAEVKVVCYSVFLYFILFRGGEPQAFVYFQF